MTTTPTSMAWSLTSAAARPTSTRAGRSSSKACGWGSREKAKGKKRKAKGKKAFKQESRKPGNQEKKKTEEKQSVGQRLRPLPTMPGRQETEMGMRKAGKQEGKQSKIQNPKSKI